MTRESTFVAQVEAVARSQPQGSQAKIVAENILTTTQGERLAGALERLGYKDFKSIGADAGALVLESRGDLIRVDIGQPAARPQIAEVLQSKYQGTVGQLGFEVLPSVDRAEAGQAKQVDELVASLRERGYALRDGGRESVGFYEGNAVVADARALTGADELNGKSVALGVDERAPAKSDHAVAADVRSAGPAHVSYQVGLEHNLAGLDANAAAAHGQRPALVVRELEHQAAPMQAASAPDQPSQAGRSSEVVSDPPRDLMIREPNGNLQSGQVVSLTVEHAYLKVSDMIAVRYDRETLSRELGIGEHVSIRSEGGKSMVLGKDMERSSEPSRDLGRER